MTPRLTPATALCAGIALIMFNAASADEAPPGVPPTGTEQVAPEAPAATPTEARKGARVAGPEKTVPGAKIDRLELDPTSVRGNQELPKVLYIVPWKDPGLAEPAGRPVGSLIDEVLAPVDREVFRRQTSYFEQLYPLGGADKSGAPGAPR